MFCRIPCLRNWALLSSKMSIMCSSNRANELSFKKNHTSRWHHSFLQMIDGRSPHTVMSNDGQCQKIVNKKSFLPSSPSKHIRTNQEKKRSQINRQRQCTNLPDHRLAYQTLARAHCLGLRHLHQYRSFPHRSLSPSPLPAVETITSALSILKAQP